MIGDYRDCVDLDFNPALNGAPNLRGIYVPTTFLTTGMEEIILRKLSCTSPLARLLTICGIAAISVLGSAQTYVFTDLGASVSGSSTATDISPSGIVAGITAAGACTWTPNGSGGMTFRSLGHAPKATTWTAFGVNDAGEVVGLQDSLTYPNIFANGYLWTGSSWLGLTKLSVQSEAYGINATGSVVGLASSRNYEAVLWKGGKQYTIPSGTMAFGINDYGQVVGQGGPTTAPVPFIWTPSKQNGTSGTTRQLPLSGGRALGLDIFGDVVGDDENGVAYYWANGASSVVSLGTLGGTYSSAGKINVHGQVVGTAGLARANGHTYTHGFIWDSVNGMRDLSSLDILGVPVGWVFLCGGLGGMIAHNVASLSINDAGQICGTIFVYGGPQVVTHAFLLTPQ